jgi:hypothetical protein
MAGYTGLATYGDNEAAGWRLISLVSYETIMRPADESFNRMMGSSWQPFGGGRPWRLGRAPTG